MQYFETWPMGEAILFASHIYYKRFFSFSFPYGEGKVGKKWEASYRVVTTIASMGLISILPLVGNSGISNTNTHRGYNREVIYYFQSGKLISYTDQPNCILSPLVCPQGPNQSWL